jgi:predicted RNA-binding Zn ribbon-like protein
MSASPHWAQPLQIDHPQQPQVAVDLSSFEHIYRTSYSHGLEKIYALENVDIRSVRKIGSRLPAAVNRRAPLRAKPRLRLQESQQLEFAFCRLEVEEPFALREPIQVLGLSRAVTAKLQARGYRQLRDLIHIDLRTQLAGQGIGQGHIEDLCETLENYLAKSQLQNGQPLDFAAWARSLIGDLDPRYSTLLLEPFELAHLVTLSPSENAEMRRLNAESRRSWQQEALQALRLPASRQQVDRDLREIRDKFLAPWLAKRHCCATESELAERLLNLGSWLPEEVHVWRWIKSVYFDERSPFEALFESVDNGIFCSNGATAIQYNCVIDTARSYFYKVDLCYSFSDLVKWIQRECARAWAGFADGFIERALRLSPQFRVRKDKNGQLAIRLAPY